MPSALHLIKRVILGRALASNRMGETLLPKRIALPVFCSDPISSVAYATEQIVFVLGTAGAASFLGLATPIAVAVALLLAIVVASYRQTCFAYPTGGEGVGELPCCGEAHGHDRVHECKSPRRGAAGPKFRMFMRSSE